VQTTFCIFFPCHQLFSFVGCDFCSISCSSHFRVSLFELRGKSAEDVICNAIGGEASLLAYVRRRNLYMNAISIALHFEPLPFMISQ
jgi:hypothetical protein